MSNFHGTQRTSKQFPNFLIDTILEDKPQNDVAKPVTSSNSYVYAKYSREQALRMYAHRLSQWRSLIQGTQDEGNPQAEVQSNSESDGNDVCCHGDVWNPVYSETLRKNKNLHNCISKLRKMSRDLVEVDEDERATSDGCTGENDKVVDTETNDGDSKQSDDMQLLWPAWVYCTRYSNRPSAGPRTRKYKRKRNIRARTTFSAEQIDKLQKEFESSQYLNEERKARLSTNLGLTVAQIKVWFQNKRAKVRKNSPVRFLATQLSAQGLYDHSIKPNTNQEKV